MVRHSFSPPVQGKVAILSEGSHSRIQSSNPDGDKLRTGALGVPTGRQVTCVTSILWWYSNLGFSIRHGPSQSEGVSGFGRDVQVCKVREFQVSCFPSPFDKNRRVWKRACRGGDDRLDKSWSTCMKDKSAATAMLRGLVYRPTGRPNANASLLLS